MQRWYKSNLNVASPPIGRCLGELKFLLFESSVTFVGDLNEDEDHAHHDTTSHHHEHTWGKVWGAIRDQGSWQNQSEYSQYKRVLYI